VVGGLAFILHGALTFNIYRGGIPTTATIDHCGSQTEIVGTTRDETCYGRWSVGGVSQTGPIYGSLTNGHDGVGSLVNVHVRGGHAYAASWGKPWVHLAMSVGLFLVATGLVLWWSARRKNKTGSWPWSRRRT
jgi:hypothetical protein